MPSVSPQVPTWKHVACEFQPLETTVTWENARWAGRLVVSFLLVYKVGSPQTWRRCLEE